MKAPVLRDVHIGCAGWAIPREHAARFPSTGSHLTRYASRFTAVEINSSFYRAHRPATYARWAASVPAGFRFAVKVPREITHVQRLSDPAAILGQFLEGVGNLGEKLGPLLVQLPPSLAFNPKSVQQFLAILRERFDGTAVWEPRHRTWFEPAATALLQQYRVARVAADPAIVPAAATPGGWDGMVYYRLHGSPRMYYSAYGSDYLNALAIPLATAGPAAWCIFDNTALGAATDDALSLAERLRT